MATVSGNDRATEGHAAATNGVPPEELEQEHMAREFKWLMAEEAPMTFMRIGRLLQDCLDRLSSGQTTAAHAMNLPPRPERLDALDDEEVLGAQATASPTASSTTPPVSRRQRVARLLRNPTGSSPKSSPKSSPRFKRGSSPRLSRGSAERRDSSEPKSPRGSGGAAADAAAATAAAAAPPRKASGVAGGAVVEAIRLGEEYTDRTVGAVRLVDTKITMIKLSWQIPRQGKGSAMHIESTLHGDVSLSVEQLRSAMNKLRLSLAEINNGIPSVRGPQHYAKIMQAILDHCCAAKASLTTRISHFCEVTVLRKEMFSPPLQRDVLIDVFMDHGDVCVEAAVLAEPASPGSTHRDDEYTPRRVGSVFQDEAGRWCEVASVHRSFGVVPCISEVLRDLTLLVEHAQKMQDKLSIFQRRT